jgi:lysozyme
MLGVSLLLAGVVVPDGRKALVDEPSREDLSEYGASFSTQVKAFPRVFKFPEDAKSSQTFGIDVSHYQGTVDWDKVLAQRVSFAFVKATQGRALYDPTFVANWQDTETIHAKTPSFHHGAYHFMTAVDSPDLQASNFIQTVGKNVASDLPACLDVEWDLETRSGKLVLDRDGKRIDQWAAVPASEIVRRIRRWLDLVEAATGKKPIIYTHAQWWNPRIGENESLIGYTFWISDFSSKSLGRETPIVPMHVKWSFWQMTDQGILSGGGVGKSVDASAYRGSQAEFDAEFLSH